MTLWQMRPIRLRWAVVVVFLTVGPTALLPTQAAFAAGEIEVSDDGVTFGTIYSGVLFDSLEKIVPGDTQNEVFYVRNDAPDDGYLRITLRDVTGSTDLTASLSVSASVPSQIGAAVELAKGKPCWVLNEGILLESGATIAVTAELSFDVASMNITQNSTADFNIGVSLTDTAVELPPTDCGGPSTVIPGVVPQPGELSYTGSDVPVILISVTAFITGVGLFLVVAARRRKREHDGETLSS